MVLVEMCIKTQERLIAGFDKPKTLVRRVVFPGPIVTNPSIRRLAYNCFAEAENVFFTAEKLVRARMQKSARKVARKCTQGCKKMHARLQKSARKVAQSLSPRFGLSDWPQTVAL